MVSIKKKGIKGVKEGMSKRRKIAIIIALLLALTASVAILLKFKTAHAGTESGDIPTETAPVERMDLVQSLTLSGTVVSGATYSVTSPITEVEITSVNVKVGDRVLVHAGCILQVVTASEAEEMEQLFSELNEAAAGGVV